MQSDEIVWQILNQDFCSYKCKTETQTLCRNEYNVSGLCTRQNCPLANSQYATIKEIEGTLYLYTKTIERAHTPAKLWKKLKLSQNYDKATQQIEETLEYWPNFNIHKCKQRLTKMTQYLIKMRRLQLKPKPVLEKIHKKIERRDASREEKAYKAAHIEKNVENALLKRLEQGEYGELYGDTIVNYPTSAFNKTADEKEVVSDTELVELDTDEEQELESEMEEDIDDMEDYEQMEGTPELEMEGALYN